MKKVLPVIFVLALLGIGGYYFVMGKKTAPADQSGLTASGQTESGKNGVVISSIKEAMAGMQPIECDYTDEQGNQVKAMVKGENIKVSGYAASETGAKGSALIKGNTMYIWEEGAKTGMMMTVDREAAAEQSENKKDETIQGLEKYKDSCRRGGFSDSVFEVPADVKFSDFSQSLINPGTINDSSGQTPNAEDVEKMMEKYKDMPSAGNE